MQSGPKFHIMTKDIAARNELFILSGGGERERGLSKVFETDERGSFLGFTRGLPYTFPFIFTSLEDTCTSTDGTGSLQRSPAAAQHHLTFPGKTCPLPAPNKHGLFSHALFSVETS
ncbi:hypothetical protein JOB18_024333 [Solea senegalensis]|uniref:Uncharacterized protein n=1 Tax=Solea senegalensis TaxID=28829 RepID=A0AAV6RZ94_SOLSE|nr:hypothetical protein JOB18_024333 [Solea senegalensis]